MAEVVDKYTYTLNKNYRSRRDEIKEAVIIIELVDISSQCSYDKVCFIHYANYRYQ